MPRCRIPRQHPIEQGAELLALGGRERGEKRLFLRLHRRARTAGKRLARGGEREQDFPPILRVGCRVKRAEIVQAADRAANGCAVEPGQGADRKSAHRAAAGKHLQHAPFGRLELVKRRKRFRERTAEPSQHDAQGIKEIRCEGVFRLISHRGKRFLSVHPKLRRRRGKECLSHASPLRGSRSHRLASTSRRMVTSSPIAGMKVFIPKSERLIIPRAENPTSSFLSSGLVPTLLSVTSRLTGRVTPSSVRSPITVPLLSSFLMYFLPTKVMVGNSATLNQSAPLRSLLRWAFWVSRLAVLMVTETALALIFFGSKLILPEKSVKRPTMLAKPK